VTGSARNPYAAPSRSASDAGPRLGLGLRALRALAFLGNAFLVALPILALFSVGRANAGLFLLAGYCLGVAAASVMALAFHDRFSFWAGAAANVLGLLVCSVLLVYLAAQLDSDWWLLAVLAAPTLPNLLAIVLVRRARGPSDDTVASRQ